MTAFQVQGNAIQSNQMDLAGRLSAGTAPIVTSGGVVHAATDALVPIAPGSVDSVEPLRFIQRERCDVGAAMRRSVP